MRDDVKTAPRECGDNGGNEPAPRTCHTVMSEYRRYRYEKFKEKYEHNDGQKNDQ